MPPDWASWQSASHPRHLRHDRLQGHIDGSCLQFWGHLLVSHSTRNGSVGPGESMEAGPAAGPHQCWASVRRGSFGVKVCLASVEMERIVLGATVAFGMT
jgi:hypothetical protein